jgi:CelD/BcsL family acetyltransferase involved in cellulose biosynthesis
MALMEKTEQRHGRRPKYTPAFFESLAGLAVTDERIVWRYVEHDGRAAASHIFLRDGNMLLSWQIYFDKTFSFLKPNQYLLHDTATRLAAKGVTTLNLGASPEGAAGLATYKKKWGGEVYRYRMLHGESLLGKLS